MASIGRKLIAWTGVAANGAGIYFFLKWALKTDLLFGHVKGPPDVLLGSLCLLAIGSTVSLIWLITAIGGSVRSRRDGAHKRGRVWLGLLSAAPVVLLLVPSGLFLLFGVFEMPDAYQRLRRQRVWSLGRRGERGAPELGRALTDSDHYVRQNAASALSAMGAEAKAAIPQLIATARLRDDLTSLSAIDALGRIGPEAEDAVPVLVELLDSELVFMVASCDALAAIGPKALPAVLDALDSGNARTREGAARALGGFDADPGEIVPDLILALDDPEPSVRQTAVESLRRIGPETHGLGQKLAELLRDPDSGVRVAAADLLQGIVVEPSVRVDALIVSLENPNVYDRMNAAQRLGEMGREAEQALPALRAATDDPETRVCVRAIEAAWKIGQDSEDVVPALTELLEKDLTDPTRKRVAAMLKEVGDAASAAIPLAVAPWIDDLSSQEPRDRSRAAQRLGEMGTQAAGALPALRAALDDPEAVVRLKAAVAVWEIRDEPGDVLPVLMALLEAEEVSDDIRMRVLWALKDIGPAAKAALPTVEAIRDGDGPPNIKRFAKEACRAIEKPARPTVRVVNPARPSNYPRIGGSSSGRPVAR